MPNPNPKISVKTQFKKGNQLWRLAPQTERMFKNGDELWAACVEYFEWCAANPLLETKAFSSEGTILTEELPKMRAMTLRGLSVFCGFSHTKWNGWAKERDDLKPTIQRVEDVIYTQKFEGASAGLLNHAIIIRELGLAEKSEITGKDGGPIQTEDVTRDADDFARRMAGLAARAVSDGDGEADPGSEGST